MCWEKVSDEGKFPEEFIDGRFRLRHEIECTYELEEVIRAKFANVPPKAKTEKHQYRLWNGAYFVDCFPDMLNVSRVVSQIRTSDMYKRKR